MKGKPMNKVKSLKQIKFYDDTGKWAFLSSMYLCPIMIDGLAYKSAEHYYQSTKPLSKSMKEWVDRIRKPAMKPRPGRIRSGQRNYAKRSPEEKLALMRKAFLAKFIQNRNSERNCSEPAIPFF
jgi:predicted NAD-dependent protein-ADP-ribosyltransferase YbiA (DUF1768 family)